VATTIGKLSAILSLNSAQFSKGMRGASKRTSKFQKRMMGVTRTMRRFGAALGATAAIGLVLIVRQTLKSIDATAKLADTLGLTTKQLIGYNFAASISGVESKALATAFKRMEKNISDATLGLTTAVRAFQTLRLDFNKLKKLSPDEAFKQIADAFNKIPSQVDKARVALDLFGRSGLGLIKLLQGGSAGIEKLQREGNILSGVSDRMADKVQDFNDSMTRMKAALAGIGNVIVDELINPMGDLDAAILRSATWSQLFTRNYIQNQKGMAAAAAKYGPTILRFMGGPIGAGLSFVAQDFASNMTKAMQSDVSKYTQDLKKVEAKLKTLELFRITASRSPIGLINEIRLDETKNKLLKERKGLEMQLQFLRKKENATPEGAEAKISAAATELAEARKRIEVQQAKEVAQWVSATRTPLEKYEATIDRLNILVKSKAMGWDLYKRSVRQAREELERSTKTGIAPAESPLGQTKFLQGKASRIAFGGNISTRKIPIQGDAEQTKLLRTIADHTKRKPATPI
jgi:hypothetical protein